MPIELWPPLHVIRAQLEPGRPAPAAADAVMAAQPAGDAGAPQPDPHAGRADLLLPLEELARRRQALAARNFSAGWAPGRLVSVLHEGRLLGVLLDRQLAPGGEWRGFVAASESDWAGAHDVLLEPDDEPFEPLFGMIQAWNPVTLRPAPQWLARVQAELSATRLAAIRAVHEEYAAGTGPDIAPEPGRVALRGTGQGDFSVLTGTPLGPQDVRSGYQQIYRAAAAQLAAASARPAAAPAAARGGPAPAAQRAAPAADGTAAPGEERAPGLWPRLRRWLVGDGWVRPAFAVLAAVVVVQNLVLPAGMDVDDEEQAVRFRDLPQAEGAAASADLLLSFRPDVRIDEAQRLLQAAGAEVVAGPDARGNWYLRLPDVAGGRAVLSASPLVEAVGPP